LVTKENQNIRIGDNNFSIKEVGKMEFNIITGSKGGIGKTLTTMLILARNLELSKATLLIDLNSMNADSAIMLLVNQVGNRISHTLNITHENEQVGADVITVGKTFSCLKENIIVNYAVGCGYNPFVLYKPTAFAEFIYNIKELLQNKLNQDLDLDIQSVIIDTNYHFCNIFSQEEEHYQLYEEKILNDSNITIWFLWVYRQLNNLLDRPDENDSAIVRQTAAKIEKFFKTDKNPAFMHVFTPVALVSSQLEAQGAILKILNAIRYANDLTIKELKEVVQKNPSSSYTSFGDWTKILQQARQEVPLFGNPNNEGDTFLNTLCGAIRNNGRPINVIPLWNYHASLDKYTDRQSPDPVAQLRRFEIYNTFCELMKI
jgi:hypothetical protein